MAQSNSATTAEATFGVDGEGVHPGGGSDASLDGCEGERNGVAVRTGANGSIAGSIDARGRGRVRGGQVRDVGPPSNAGGGTGTDDVVADADGVLVGATGGREASTTTGDGTGPAADDGGDAPTAEVAE